MSPVSYLTLRAELNRGRVIPFLGSGASLIARQPSDAPWHVLKDAILDEWSTSYIPTAAELAKYLAERSDFPDGEPVELAKVAQYFNIVNGRSIMFHRLHEIFRCDHPTTSLHTYLAKIDNPLLIVTTNYDDLIERAFRAEGRPFDLVVHITDPQPDIKGDVLWWPHGQNDPTPLLAKDLDINLNEISVIYKMHGTVDKAQQERSQYVITEDDYIEFLARMTTSSPIPPIFAAPFQKRPFLFLGYGLYDWNLRVVLNRIEKGFRRPNDIVSWAVERQPKPLEQKLWESRGVRMIFQTLDEFVESLQAPKALNNANAPVAPENQQNGNQG